MRICHSNLKSWFVYNGRQRVGCNFAACATTDTGRSGLLWALRLNRLSEESQLRKRGLAWKKAVYSYEHRPEQYTLYITDFMIF